MSNKAAWIEHAKQKPLVIKAAPMPIPEAYQVVVQVRAVAFNPVDTNIQIRGFVIEEYPAIVGMDMAGIVHAVGTDVKHVRIGDRVTACVDMGHGGPDQKVWTHGTFQHFSVTHHKLVAKIPPYVSFTDACVLPLAMSTAATALFDKRCMGIALPSPKPTPQGSTLIVWGGASSVGAVAVMLGLGAGFEVITTSSAKNFDFCKSLGASEVFDYKKETVVNDIVAFMKGKQNAGVFDAIITPETMHACYEIADKTEGNKHVGSVIPPGMELPGPMPAGVESSHSKSVSEHI